MASTNKLEICEVCGGTKAKYTCPKCEVRTCGLSCVNIHKQELACDGIRDKIKFIPLHSFSDLDLLNDYRLLEDIGRSVDKFQKDLLKRSTRQTDLPIHLQRLRQAAYSSGTNLQFLPKHFSRHKENTTYLDWKSKEFFWRIELVFPQAENIKWVIEKALETNRLSTLLEEILYSESSSDLKEGVDSNSLPILQNNLKFYRSHGLTGLKALLKAEKVKKSDSKFYELDLALPLKTNFKNKVIIEFPVIYVILKDHSSMFEIIDSDDEESQPIRNKALISHKQNSDFRKVPITSEQKPKETTDSTVNYFFNAEFSDSDNDSEGDHRKNKTQKFDIPNYDELVKMES